jgi:hypothetical protein
MTYEFHDEFCMNCHDTASYFLSHIVYTRNRMYYGYCLRCADRWYHHICEAEGDDWNEWIGPFVTQSSLRDEIRSSFRNKIVTKVLNSLFYSDIACVILSFIKLKK